MVNANTGTLEDLLSRVGLLHSFSRLDLADMTSGSNYLEGADEVLIDHHHCACIVKLAAVVWSREYRDQLAIALKLVAVLHDLVGATYEIQVVFLEKSFYHIVAKRVRYTSV